MARYVNRLAFGGSPESAFAWIHQYLTSEGFEYVKYDGEDVFKKGKGLLTAPTFVKVTFTGNTVTVESWLKYALLPGIYVGELGMTGFVGCAVKGTMKKVVAQIEAMLRQYAYPQNPSIYTQPSVNQAAFQQQPTQFTNPYQN